MEENQEPKVEVKPESKKFDLSTINWKKYLPWAGIALAVIIVIIILVVALGGGPEKAVKNYISAINSKDASKIVDSMDIAGVKSWSWKYKVDDFSKDDYDDFIDKYKDIDKDDLKDYKKDAKDDIKDDMDDIKDKYKSYKMKVENIKSTEKLGKDLYVVKAKIAIEAVPKDKDDDEIDSSSIQTFVVYKNKVIYPTM